MGRCRTAHVQQRGDVDHTLLAMAQQPKDLHPLAVAHHFQQLRCRIEGVGVGDLVLQMLGVNEFMDTQVRKMSGGMKKRLSIACAVAKNPKLLLLDEPCAALDLVCKQNIYDYLARFKESGGMIVLTTHDEGDLALCDSIYILKAGKLHKYDYDGRIDSLVREL